MIRSGLFTLSILTLFSFTASAQATNYGSNSTTPVIDALGRPVANQDITKVNNTTEVYNEWFPGKVTMENGETYKDLLLKFNLKDNLLTFVYDKSEAPQKFKDNVKVFAIYADKERVFANGFPKFDGSDSNTYYEVIAGGKTMLLEHHRQYLKQVRDENRAPTVGEYTNNKRYYLYKNGQMSKTSLDKEKLLKALADQSTKMVEYAEKQNLKFDNEADAIKLLDYYNGL
ncbi:MAG: hypothetical protein JKY70_16135 [Mucilaginibacter sp.]|nr:hypothetical protein [Mucilaginibacter sp.]